MLIVIIHNLNSFFIFRLFSVAVSDVASLNPHQLSTDLSSDNKSDKQKEEIPNASEDSSRSNSDIQDSIVVKVSLATLDTTCNYKCILVSCDKMSHVIVL